MLNLIKCAAFIYSLTCYAVDTEEIFDFLPSGNKIVKSTKRIVFDQYPGAHNPSIISLPKGFLLTFRYLPDPYNQPWVSYIGVALLDDELQVISNPQLLNTRQFLKKTPSQSEDARIFSFQNKLYLIFNDNTEQIWFSNYERRYMYIAELSYSQGQFSLSRPCQLTYSEKSHIPIQKNWVPFQWEEHLLLSYTINPHEVLYLDPINANCYHCYETKSPIQWDFGILRGGTPALQIGDEYLAFFHSSCELSSPVSFDQELWHYFMGAYTFSASPPFEIQKISPFPIIADNFYSPSYYNKRVIFPGGFVLSNDNIYMAYGKDDFEIWIATLDRKALMNSLITLQR